MGQVLHWATLTRTDIVTSTYVHCPGATDCTETWVAGDSVMQPVRTLPVRECTRQVRDLQT